jgi:opacity protein-like surface antigen
MRGLLTAAVLLFSTTASAATYVDAPTIGRSTVGFSMYGGAPLGSSHGDERASVLGGGGSELHYGYAWESGFALASVFGGGRWSSRGPLAQTLRDRDASITEGYAGVSMRYLLWDSEVAPFIGGMVLLDYARVRGTYSGDASGLATAARAGLRWREHPWDLFGAVELRHARLSAPYDESDPLITTRFSLVFGVAFESAAH